MALLLRDDIGAVALADGGLMVRCFTSTWVGALATAVTLGVAAIVWALVGAPLPSVGMVVALVLLGEALLMLFAARQTLWPFQQRLTRHPASGPNARGPVGPVDPLCINTHWLWNALPAALVGLLLLFLALV